MDEVLQAVYEEIDAAREKLDGPDMDHTWMVRQELYVLKRRLQERFPQEGEVKCTKT